MRFEKFKEYFIDFREKLEMFFHNKLKEARISGNRKEIRDELINITAEKILKILSEDKYPHYNFDALIMLKARNVWSEFINSRNHPLNKTIDFDVVNRDDNMYFDLKNEVELKDKIAFLKSIIPEEDFKVFTYLADGFKYEEISELTGKSQMAIKQRVYRVRCDLRKGGFDDLMTL
jgi:DNA-directed RNA polymerase specialized sigma24 family protein